jgi:hypothetical protein
MQLLGGGGGGGGEGLVQLDKPQKNARASREKKQRKGGALNRYYTVAADFIKCNVEEVAIFGLTSEVIFFMQYIDE